MIDRGKLAVIAGLPLIAAGFYLLAASHAGNIPGGTMVYCRYAQDLIDGAGMAPAAGTPSSGFASPLWILLLAAGGKMGVDLLTAAQGIDLLFAGCAVAVFFLVAFEMIRDITVALFATAAFASNAWFIRWAGSGMETSFALFLALGAVYYTLRNEYLLAMIVAALLALVRPEAFLAAPLILADAWINSNDKHRAGRLITAGVAAYAVVVLPWLVYASMRLGAAVPDAHAPAVAAAAAGPELSLATRAGLAMSFASDGTAIFLLAVMTILLVRTLRTKGGELRFVLFRQGFVAAGLIIALPLVLLASGAPLTQRLLLIALPFAGLLAFAHLAHAFVILRGPVSMRWAALCALIAIAVPNLLLWFNAVRPGLAAAAVAALSASAQRGGTL